MTYYLKAAPDSTTVVSLDFKDAQGRLLRSYSTKPTASLPAAGQPASSQSALPAKAGNQSFHRDLREETPTRSAGLLGPGQQRGRRVPAGRYTATLTERKRFVVVDRPVRRAARSARRAHGRRRAGSRQRIARR